MYKVTNIHAKITNNDDICALSNNCGLRGTLSAFNELWKKDWKNEPQESSEELFVKPTLDKKVKLQYDQP